MRVAATLTLVSSLLFAPGCGKDSPTTPAPPSLDGDYRMTRMWVLDRWIEPKADLFMTVKGESMTSGGGCLGVGTNPIKFDATKTPAEIDLFLPEGEKGTLRATRGSTNSTATNSRSSSPWATTPRGRRTSPPTKRWRSSWRSGSDAEGVS